MAVGRRTLDIGGMAVIGAGVFAFATQDGETNRFELVPTKTN